MNEFITVVLLHLFAVMSPGPDYVLITRQSIRYGRRVALWSSGGIGIGILFHSVLAVTGNVTAESSCGGVSLPPLTGILLIILCRSSVIQLKHVGITELPCTLTIVQMIMDVIQLIGIHWIPVMPFLP